MPDVIYPELPQTLSLKKLSIEEFIGMCTTLSVQGNCKQVDNTGNGHYEISYPEDSTNIENIGAAPCLITVFRTDAEIVSSHHLLTATDIESYLETGTTESQTFLRFIVMLERYSGQVQEMHLFGNCLVPRKPDDEDDLRIRAQENQRLHKLVIDLLLKFGIQSFIDHREVDKVMSVNTLFVAPDKIYYAHQQLTVMKK